MEFNEEFALIQGSLLTCEKNIGNLKNLSFKKGEDTKIGIVVDTVQKAIAGRGIKAQNECDISQSLRRINMFFILNTNLNIQEKLTEDINCGHIVDCAPNLSKDLLMELINQLSLYKYFCEAIIYVPLYLGVELLDAALIKIGMMEPFEALGMIEKLSKAVYNKFVHLDILQEGASKCVQSKLFTYFKTLLEYFIRPKLAGLISATSSELYCYSGVAMKCLLSITSDCLKLYLNPIEQKPDLREIYDITLPEFYDPNEKQIVTSSTFISELLSVCKTNCSSITVDIWLYWAECLIGPEADKGKPLQKIIPEAMYNICELLKTVKNKTQVLLAAEIISMFSSMAVKPKDEDDEIKEANVDIIIESISDKTKCQRKWFKALLNLSDVMIEQKCLSCLENNLDLADYEDVKMIIEKTVTVLHSEQSEASKNAKKKLGLEAMKHLSLDQQVEIVHWYFEKYDIGAVTLMQDNFHVFSTEVFNKAVKIPDDSNKFLSDFLCLCMQSSVDVVAKVLKEGLTNAQQIPLMVKILKCLNPICSMRYVKEEKASVLIIFLLDKMMNEEIIDTEKLNFVIFVVALINHNIVDGSIFLKICLLPTLYNSLSRRLWSELLIWLEILHAFINGTVTVPLHGLHCPLLVMLAQVIEVARWNIFTFSNAAASVCERALAIVGSLMKKFLEVKDREDKEVRWLQMKLKFLSHLNRSYFSKLWSKYGKDWLQSAYTADIFLLDMIQADGFSEEIEIKASGLFEDVERKKSVILFSFSKLLPLCTSSEWKILAKKIDYVEKALKTDTVKPPIHIFLESVHLLLCAVTDEDLEHNDHVLSCLDYCIRNLGLVMKENPVTEMKNVPLDIKFQLFIKLIHVLGKLPESIKNSCSILLLNFLVEMLQDILMCENASVTQRIHYTSEIVTHLGILGNNEALEILARKLLEILNVEGAAISSTDS